VDGAYVGAPVERLRDRLHAIAAGVDSGLRRLRAMPAALVIGNGAVDE
jgi:hypothetical protein